jgi:tryptophan synthase beta chain
MPDDDAFFGPFGGRYVAETLRPALEQLTEAFAEIKKDEVAVFLKFRTW